MGVIYKMNCERCGTRFEHQAGVGLFCSCPTCGDAADESTPFFCPVCNRRYDPMSWGFEDSVVETIMWD